MSESFDRQNSDLLRSGQKINILINDNFGVFCVFSFIYIATILIILYYYLCLWAYSDIRLSKDPELSLFAIVLGGLGAYTKIITCYYRSGKYYFCEKSNASVHYKSKFLVLCLLLLPITIGNLTGFIVYTLLSGGIIQGALFPVFSCKSGASPGTLQAECKTFISVISYWTPADPQSYVKTFLWCYVAGFYQEYLTAFLSRFSFRR